MNKETFLEKCKTEYNNAKLRVPEKAGFIFRGWLTGPANESFVKAIWKNNKKAMIEIADYIGDTSWLPYDAMLELSKKEGEESEEEIEDEEEDTNIYCEPQDHFLDPRGKCLICGKIIGLERPIKKIDTNKIGFSSNSVEEFEAKAEKAWHYIMTHVGKGSKKGRFSEWLRVRKTDCIRFYGSMSEAEEVLYDKFDCNYVGDD